MTAKQTNTLTGINFKIMPNVGYLIAIRLNTDRTSSLGCE